MNLLRSAGLLAVLCTTFHAQYVVDGTKIPQTGSFTENVDFADIDLDGDWDVAVADGAEIGNDQNRIWVNQGGLQGGERGLFLDQTSTQAPAVLDASRDIEFVDFDGDGDPDVFVSNTSSVVPQSSRWWTNPGGLQGGAAGFYVDETAARWVGLGGAGSSLPPALILGSGGFIDWSGDGDFGDLDMDGDLDLVHSSYGPAQGGQTPTRIFLNDGLGFFAEFNPSGFKLSSSAIQPGSPGLWSDGVQTADTTDATGAQCDVASSALDVHVGDIDGDLDLDILHGAKNQPPRMFANRLEASGLAPSAGAGLGFRDVTGAVFPPGYASSSHHYAQELGDLDGDGDLDILGLDWVMEGALYKDVTLANDGTGHYGAPAVLPGSTAADNECDFLDYDNDGDLDAYVATFSGGRDVLYRNDQDGGAGFSFTEVPLPLVDKFTYDADACDTDGDGDYDVLAAEEVSAHETLYRNTTQTPDTHAPVIPKLEQLPDGQAAAGERMVRAHVYDNAPYYITWYNPTWLEVAIGGVALPDRGMRSSAGQLFRGTLERNLLGAVSYRVRSQDEHGNTGSSAALSYTATGGPAGTLYGATTAGSLGPPTLAALSLPLAGETLYLAAGNVPAGTPCFIAVSGATLPSIDLGSGFLLQIALPTFLVAALTADADGHALIFGELPPGSAGLTLACQAVSVDGTGGNAFASSQGLELAIQ